MRREVLGGFGAAAALVFGFACGGYVVVDPESSTGSGGFGSTTTTTSDGQGGDGAACGFPPPVGDVYNCGGSTSSGTGAGGPVECITFYCDDGGNSYAASCTSGACACQHNGATLCTCAVNGSGDICAGTAEPCCPFPIAQ